MGKITSKLGYAGVALDTGIGIYENVQDGSSWQETTSDAIIDTTISGCTLAVSIKVGSVVGTAIPIPVVGTILGGGAGLGIGLLINFATDSIKVNDTSFRDYVQDDAVNAFGW